MRTVAGRVDGAVGGDDLLVVINSNHLVVELIADQGVAVPQAYGAGGRWRGIATRPGAGVKLPNVRVGGVYFDDAVVSGVGE